MKSKTQKFRIGDNTYFHHRHGIYLRKNRVRSFALTSSVLAVMIGGFFVGREFAWPILQKNAQVQRVHQIATDTFVSAESDPGNEGIEPIRVEDDLLRSVLEDKITTFDPDEKWAVFVYDLNTERTASVNTDETFASASLYKLFLLEALENKLPFDQWQWTWIGSSSVLDCIDAMLKTSDDPCAQELGEYIGWDEIERLSQENGYTNTKLSQTDGRETTAKDMGELLARMKKGQVLSDYARRFVFDALYQQTIKKGMAEGCNKCRSANKLGELSDVAHDAGIVTHGTHDYVLVIMSEGGTFKQIEQLTKLVELEFAPAR